MSGFSIKANNPIFKRPQGAKLALGQPKAPAKPAHVGELFGADDEDEQAAKRARTEAPPALSGLVDAETREVATKLADFVAKNGAQFEDLTRERNPGSDTPFSFLHNKSSPGYQFYAAKLREFQAAAAGGGAAGGPAPPPLPPPPPLPAAGGDAGARRPSFVPPPSSASASAAAGSRPAGSGRWGQGPPSASPPPPPPGAPGTSVFSALPPEAAAAVAAAAAAAKAAAAAAAAGRLRSFSPSPSAELTAEAKEEAEAEARRRAQIALAQGDSVGAMEAFARLAARRDRGRSASADPDDPDGAAGGDDDDDEEARRRRAEPLLNKTAFERRKVTAVYKDDGSRGHHMGDYIPKEVLAQFMAKTGDKVAQVQAEQLANKNAIGSDNIGHKLLSKMGWKEGEGLGGTQKGITAPIKASAAAPAAGEQRGLGATAVGEVTAEDDAFEAYRKRMMLGYKYRPNPLGNPRRAYY
ncbi:hypothetical protein HXX76_006953 [Chlamydomonas incerta]|uniref:SURP and G-patch domain-containing protein 1-like protein n=1 Tax=Chlamydomonas incerta TaxID=51695 RepID=A0A835SYN7_CHLIN|nr:hypothetical protein HXX76_006953 [Chlamydomonas incerta]|eukprot:KAG2435757.1 hypothetical protein HXX76_006953 [Chlamydomonas incerta]